MALKSKAASRKLLQRAGRYSNGRSNIRRYPYFVVYVGEDSSEVSLVTGRIYQVIRPEANDWADSLRVIDEEKEDYLYPADLFVPVDLPARARRAVVAAAV